MFCCILGCLLFLISIEFVFSCTVLFVCISQVIGCEDRLRNDLYCVKWGVKLYSNQTKPKPGTLRPPDGLQHGNSSGVRYVPLAWIGRRIIQIAVAAGPTTYRPAAGHYDRTKCRTNLNECSASHYFDHFSAYSLQRSPRPPSCILGACF